MRWLLAILSGLVPLLVRANPAADTVRISQLSGRISLYERATVTSTDCETTYEKALSDTRRIILRHGQTTDARQAYWLHIFLKNDTDTIQTTYLSSADNQLVTLYLLLDGHTHSQRFGSSVSTPDWPTAENEKYAPITLGNGRVAELWIRVANARGVLPPITRSSFPRPSLSLSFQTATDYNEQLLHNRQRNALELQNRSWIEGALLFFLFFVAFIYLRYPQPLYGYYALYVLAGCSYALLKARSYTPVGHWLGYAPMLQAHLLEPVIWAGWSAYLFFLMALLTLGQRHPLAARRIRGCARVAIAYSLLYAVLLLLTNDGGLQQIGFWMSRIVFVSAHIAILAWLARAVPSPLTRYVLLGNALLITVGIMASLRASNVLPDGIFLISELENLLMLSFGILLEIVVFALALAYRIHLIDREKIETQRAYIEEIEQRTIYEKRIAEVEMLALRSQMNPHFLFNSLNTIEYFVLKGDEEKATRYLSDFSRLLRLTLNHSNEETVRLSEELMGLRLYLSLEATRFGDEFHYTIEADAAIDQDDVRLPPLLLQPFVENAIWHGLRQSDRPNKRLWIRLLVQDEQTLRFEIEDNGIGRRQAADLKSRSATQRKSFGMDITRQRMDLFNKNYASRLSIDLIDLENNGQTGTLVRMTYQLNAINSH
ncbi:histidine kinase [Spirosoma spitsbergense]|uniref:histidine kinase n=1 Tax=Spirosoma spitsbergense TaxID=431554 RepID=UPI0005A9139C|nr:histidine kinase [Spirosoma spitsbergense]